MAYEQPGMVITLKASADVSDPSQTYRAVKLGTNVGEFAIAAAGEKCVGIMQTPMPQDKAVRIMVSGISFARASAAIGYGASVQAAANGQVSAGSTNPIGTALTAATAAGDIISVLLGR